MAELTITIPDDKATLVVNSFASAHGWTADMGLTKAQFFKSKVIEFIKATVRREEFRQAEAAIPPPTDIEFT